MQQSRLKSIIAALTCVFGCLYLSLGSLHAAIAKVDSFGPVGGQTPATATTLTQAFTLTAPANVLIITVANRASAGGATSVSYGGVALTKAATVDSANTTVRTSQIWYLFNPVTGVANNVTISYTSVTVDYVIGGFTLSGVDTTKLPLNVSVDGLTSNVATTGALNIPTANSWAAVSEALQQNYGSTFTFASTVGGVASGVGSTYYSGNASGTTQVTAGAGVVANLTAGSNVFTGTASDLGGSNKNLVAVSVFTPAAVAAVTRTTVTDGNWGNPATWDTGVPATGDTALIRHAVALKDTGGTDTSYSAGSVTFDGPAVNSTGTYGLAGASGVSLSLTVGTVTVSNSAAPIISANLAFGAIIANLVVSSTGIPVFNGSITGTGGIIKSGAGTADFSGNNTYTGTTFIYEGLSRINVNAALPATTVLTLGNGATAGSITFAPGLTNTITALNVVSTSTAINTITLGLNTVLTCTGNVIVGSNAGSGTTTNAAITGAGKFAVNNAGGTGIFQINGATNTNTATNSASLNMSGLALFDCNLGTTGTGLFRIGETSTVSSVVAPILVRSRWIARSLCRRLDWASMARSNRRSINCSWAAGPLLLMPTPSLRAQCSSWRAAPAAPDRPAGCCSIRRRARSNFAQQTARVRPRSASATMPQPALPPNC